MTELILNRCEKKEEKTRIGDLPDGTFFEYEDTIYVKNSFKEADTYSLCGKYALIRGYYDSKYPDRVFKTVEINLS